MDGREMVPKIKDLSIKDYAMSNFSEFWIGKEEKLDILIRKVTSEIDDIERAASSPYLPVTMIEAKRIKAIWVFSGAGTYEKPITNTSGDISYKNKVWIHNSDKKRIDYAIKLIGQISMIASGKYSFLEVSDSTISRKSKNKLIRDFGPYLIYNGISVQNQDLLHAIKKDKELFPIEKIIIPKGRVHNTIDQIKNFRLSKKIILKPLDVIGIVSHAPHLARVLRIMNKYCSFMCNFKIILYPLISDNIKGENEFVMSEIRGIVGYISTEKATMEPIPYDLDNSISEAEATEDVTIQPVDESDMMPVYKLSNNKSVRQNSFNPEPIELESHQKWFEAKLKDENTIMLKAVLGENFAGQARLEINGGTALVGVSIDEEFRGKGIASKLLREIIEIAENKGVKAIEAFIKPENQASIKLFEKAGFIFDQEIEVSGKSALKFVYKITNPSYVQT